MSGDGTRSGSSNSTTSLLIPSFIRIMCDNLSPHTSYQSCGKSIAHPCVLVKTASILRARTIRRVGLPIRLLRRKSFTYCVKTIRRGTSAFILVTRFRLRNSPAYLSAYKTPSRSSTCYWRGGSLAHL